MTKEGENIFMCLLAIFIESLFKLFTQFFLLGFLHFFLLICRNSLYILDTNILLDICIAGIFSMYTSCLSIPFIMNFDEDFNIIHFINLSLMIGAFGVLFVESWPLTRLWRFSLLLILETLCFCLSYWHLYLESIFVYVVR